MAISVHPVDGLINRLLQQNSSSVSRRGSVQQPARPDSADRVEISTQAKQGVAEQPASKLESQLLQLYSRHS